MSNQISAPITLIQNVITAPISLGVAGGGAGASAFTDLTDKATADIPTINTPLATVLFGKLSTTTAASTYAPISTTVTLTGTQTLENKTFANTTNFGNISASGNIFSSVGFSGPGGNLTGLDAGNLTGNIALARIANALTAPGPIGGTTPAPITGTTGTFNGNTSVPAHTFTALRINGGSYFCYGGAGFMLALDGNYNTGTRWQSFVDGKVRISGVASATGVYFDLLTSGTLKVRNYADNADGDITAANLTASGVIKTGSQTAAVAIASSHATAIAAGDGAQTYISDTDKPAWSNGTVWKYADGTTVS